MSYSTVESLIYPKEQHLKCSETNETWKNKWFQQIMNSIIVAMPKSWLPDHVFLTNMCICKEWQKTYMYAMHTRGVQTDGRATNSCYKYGDFPWPISGSQLNSTQLNSNRFIVASNIHRRKIWHEDNSKQQRGTLKWLCICCTKRIFPSSAPLITLILF